jgi:hypothetical protein
MKKPYKVEFDFNGQSRAKEIVNGSSIASQVYNLLNTVKKTYEWDNMKIRQMDGTLNDLSHKLEATTDPKEILRVGREMQQLRVQRRILKYERSQLENFYNSITKGNMIQSIQSCNSSVDSEKHAQSNLKYWCRDDKMDESISAQMGTFYSDIKISYKKPQPKKQIA